MAQENSDDCNIDNFYDGSEPLEHWNLRKHFIQVHKEKFPLIRLVALSKALTDIEFLASIYSSPLIIQQTHKKSKKKEKLLAIPKKSALLTGVKLHYVENPWRPARYNANENMSEDEKKTDKLYKKVRAILNKLTPQKFDTLTNQTKQLTIDTKDHLQGVVDLFVTQAIKEPMYSNCYALLCKDLAEIQMPTLLEEKESDGDFVIFKQLLVTKCEMELEKNLSSDDTKRNALIQAIDDCQDPREKKKLLLYLEEYDRDIRIKSVRCAKFIGELFMQEMLSIHIVMRCLNDFIEKKDEKRLECLCKLLTTAGKELEEKRENLNPIFDQMKGIVDKEHGKISNRIRFMLLDVIDFRKNCWVPIRRQSFSPITIDQLQKEIEAEENAKKDNRRNRKGHAKNNPGSVQPVTQSKELKNVLPQVKTPTAWLTGDGLPAQPPVLDEEQSTSRFNSRSGSQHRSNVSLTEPLSWRRRSPSQSSSKAVPSTAVQQQQQPAIVLNKKMERRLRNILEDYQNECCFDGSDQVIKESLPASALPKLVSYGYLYVLERSPAARLQTGLLFATLIKRGTLPLEDYCTGLQEVLAQVDDLMINTPNVWNYLADFLLYPVGDQALPLTTLHTCCNDLIRKKYAESLLKPLFNLIMEEKGPIFLQSIWTSSGLTFNDFIASAPDVIKFVKNNKFDFLAGEQELLFQQIYGNLLHLFNAKASLDDFVNCIHTDAGERVKDKEFMRTLASAVFEDIIVKQLNV